MREYEFLWMRVASVFRCRNILLRIVHIMEVIAGSIDRMLRVLMLESSKAYECSWDGASERDDKREFRLVRNRLLWSVRVSQEAGWENGMLVNIMGCFG